MCETTTASACPTPVPATRTKKPRLRGPANSLWCQLALGFKLITNAGTLLGILARDAACICRDPEEQDWVLRVSVRVDVRICLAVVSKIPISEGDPNSISGTGETDERQF